MEGSHFDPLTGSEYRKCLREALYGFRLSPRRSGDGPMQRLYITPDVKLCRCWRVEGAIEPDVRDGPSPIWRSWANFISRINRFLLVVDFRRWRVINDTIPSSLVHNHRLTLRFLPMFYESFGAVGGVLAATGPALSLPHDWKCAHRCSVALAMAGVDVSGSQHFSLSPGSHE